MKVFIYALFFHLTLNVYVFWRGWQILAPKKTFRILFAGIFATEFLVYLTGLFFYNRLSDEIVQDIWRIGTTWMLFVLYMAMILIVIDLLFVVHKRKPFLPPAIHSRQERTKAGWFIFSLFVVIVLLSYGNYKFHHPSVERRTVAIDKKAGNIDSLKIVFAGDLHLGYLIDKPYARKYVNLIMEQNPDLILFTGDVVDAEIKPLINQRMDEELRRLHASLGVYGCTGNHEYRYEAEEKIAWLNHSGITMLRDSAVLIDSAFYIVGREDLMAPVRKPLEQILREQHMDRALPFIVLNHNPIDLDEEAYSGADIALYGHTHRGQFFPANFLSDMLFEVSHGYKKKDNTNFFVTSGLGLAGPQYRIGTQSEIVVMTVNFRR